MSRRRCLITLLSLLVPAIHAGAAANPESAAANRESAAANPERVTEVVLVTASSSAEDASNMPLAWSRVEGSDIELVAPVHINEIMQRVPGAWVSRGNGQESLIALRSPVLTGAGSCGAFFTAMDGISLRAPGFCNVNQLFDANFEQAGRIEVIRGPATSLFGSNAMHGVINVLSAAPSPTLDHRLSVEGGPDDFYRGSYRYSNTWGDHGISFRGNGTTYGGYQDDSGYDQQKLTLRYDYDGGDWDIRTVLDGANLNQETAGYIQGYQSYQDSDIRKTNPNPEAYRDASSLRLYSAASLSLSEEYTLSVTPYFRDNDMKFLQHFVPWQPVEKNAHTSAGLRTVLHAAGDSLHRLAGVDLEYTRGKLEETQAEPFSANQPAGTHYDYEVDATTAAAYAQLRTAWDSPWELAGGARLEFTRYDYDNRTQDGAPCEPEADNCRFFRPADRDDDFGDWSLNGGFSYAFDETLLAYLRLARGFRAPQAAELYRLQAGQQVADLDSEQIDNIELGLRGTLGGRLSYDTAVFYMHKDEVIFQDANRFNVSGAETRHYGAEVQLSMQLAQYWSMSVDATAASHTYDNRVELLESSGDIRGNDIDTAPNWFGSARLEWDTTQLIGRPGRAELEWVYMDAYYLEPDNQHRYDGHSLLNLRFTAQWTPRWSGGLRVTNLLDEEYAERADFGFGEYRYFVGQPRGAYVEIGYRFGLD